MQSKAINPKNVSGSGQSVFEPAFGATKLEELVSHTIQKFYNSLQVSGLSAKTIKNIHGVLHIALQQAIANKYIHQNPSDACKLPKVHRPEITPLEPVELSVILDTAERDAYCNLFIVGMFTGMRQGELLGL